MMRTLFCLVFILTSSVVARAGFDPNGNNAPAWIPTHQGLTDIDGLPVTAIFEESANRQQTLTPSLLPVVRPNVRLVIRVSHNPSIQAVYDLQPRTLSLAGEARFAYVSELDQDLGISLVVTPSEDGKLHVSYTRESDKGGLNGTFTLFPVPHIL